MDWELGNYTMVWCTPQAASLGGQLGAVVYDQPSGSVLVQYSDVASGNVWGFNIETGFIVRNRISSSRSYFLRVKCEVCVCVCLCVLVCASA